MGTKHKLGITSRSLAAILLAGLSATLSSIFTHAYSFDPHVVQFSVPAQAVETALVAYAEQAHVQLVVSGSILKGLGSSGVVGSYDRQAALAILLNETGLEFHLTGPETVTVTKKSPKK